MAYSGGLAWRGTPPPDDQYGGALLKAPLQIDFAKPDVFDAHANEFAALDLYFLRYFGSTNVDKVVEAMDHAVTQYDVQLVVLDNLQFMISGGGGLRAWPRRARPAG
jgi:hypothetical protein